MSAGDPRWLVRLDAMYALALRLYPRRFRREWEADMRQAFRDRCREVARGERKALALFSEIVPDLAAGVGREQFHHLQDANMLDARMFKRNLAIALALLFATLMLFQSTVSDATSQVQQWWTQRQERLADVATREYRVAVAEAAAAKATPRDRAIAGLLYASAGDPRAQAMWDQAVDAGDRLALWVSATDCPVAHCDQDRALAALAGREPGNAAVAQLLLDRAVRTGNMAAARDALHGMATASGYSGRFAELTAGLLQAVEEVPVPLRLRLHHRNQAGPEAVPVLLALDVATRVTPMPSMSAFADYCRPRAAGAMEPDCLAAARILADGDELVARVIGLGAWQRLQADGDEAGLRQRIRDHHWMVANAGIALGGEAMQADVDAWRAAWRESSGEIGVLHRLMRDQGIPIHAPAGFEVDAKYLDPGR